MSIIQQNSLSGIEMEPPVQITTVPYYQQPQIIMPHMPRIMKSCPLIGFGVILFILSVTTLGLGAWASSFTVRPHYAYGSLGCSVFFLLTSLLCMYGGNDVASRKCSISTALVFGILGVIVGCVGVVLSVLAGLWFKDCKVCDVTISLGGIDPNCSTDCLYYYFPVYVGLGILTILQAFFGLILSCSACCNACSCCCCYKEAQNGFVVHPAPITTFIHTTTQAQGPPPYKRLEEVDNSDIYAPNRYNTNF